MSKRKKFQISDDINRGITEVINAVNDNVGAFRYEVVSLSRIEIDPNNPRELALTDQDIKFGIDVGDSQAAKKKKEKESLESLSHTIKQSGIINPILIYKHDDKYRIVAGERRFLAAHLAEKKDIHAKIIDKKPDEIDLKILQWIENNEREDLSLSERLKNLNAIIESYTKKQKQEYITGDVLGKLTGLSKTQSRAYLSILKGPADLKKCIEDGLISNVDKAILIADIVDNDLRATVLSACINGNSIKELKKIILENSKETRFQATKVPSRKRGRVANYINLGRTKNIAAVKKIIEIVISHSGYNKHTDRFSDIKWEEYKSVSLAFQKLLDILDKDLN